MIGLLVLDTNEQNYRKVISTITIVKTIRRKKGQMVEYEKESYLPFQSIKRNGCNMNRSFLFLHPHNANDDMDP